MKNFTNFLSTLLLASILVLGVGCNPMQLNEEPALAGDFSDPMYPKTYGRVSVDVNLDGGFSDEVATKHLKSMSLEFYYINPKDGSLVLCKEYANCLTMPSVALFPIGNYVIISQTMSSESSKEFFRGQSTLTVSETSTAIGKVKCQRLADAFTDPIYPKVYGQVELALSIDFKADDFVVGSKVDLPSIKDMIVYFYYILPDGGMKLCKRYDKFELMTQKIAFPIGNYQIKVSSHDSMPDVCDYAYFSGLASMSVSEGSVSQGEVKCNMKNSRLELRFDSGFAGAFSNWNAAMRFKGEDENAFVFTKSTPTIKFIAARDILVELKAVQVGDNQVVKSFFEVNKISAGSSIALDFSGKSQGSVNVGIEVNVTINRKDHEIKFPDTDSELGGGGFNPDPNPDPDPDPKPDPEPDPEPEPVVLPSIVGVGFDVTKIKDISTARDFDASGKLITPLKVTANAPEGGLQTFVITIDSPDIGSELLTPLFGGTSFDLANVPVGSNLESNLDALGILKKGQKVKGEAAFTFELTAFMSLLPENTITHDFTLDISDGQGNTEVQTIRIKRVK